MRWHLNMASYWLNGSSAKRFKVTVAADGPFGSVQPTSYELDVDEYGQASATPPGTMAGITKDLKELKKLIKARK